MCSAGQGHTQVAGTGSVALPDHCRLLPGVSGAIWRLKLVCHGSDDVRVHLLRCRPLQVVALRVLHRRWNIQLHERSPPCSSPFPPSEPLIPLELHQRTHQRHHCSYVQTHYTRHLQNSPCTQPRYTHPGMQLTRHATPLQQRFGCCTCTPRAAPLQGAVGAHVQLVPPARRKGT